MALTKGRLVKYVGSVPELRGELGVITEIPRSGIYKVMWPSRRQRYGPGPKQVRDNYKHCKQHEIRIANPKHTWIQEPK